MIATPHPKSGRRGAVEEPDQEELNPNEPEPDQDQDDGQPQSPEEADSQRIVLEAMRALKGQSRSPQEALSEFIETFGRKELDSLRQMVTGDAEPVRAATGRLIEGPGRGMEDRIPAAAGDQPVLLSDGEYVIPADVVSMLGDGSTKAGVRILEAMCERVRESKTGSTEQADEIDKDLLPA